MVRETLTLPGDARLTGQGRGLLITSDAALARVFRRELTLCGDCPSSFDVQPAFEHARRFAGYSCVAIDLDGAIQPAEAVRLARRAWPGARVAVLSYWWSERDAGARDLADLVIHKPLRQPELRAFLRQPAAVGPVMATAVPPQSLRPAV
jgi:hypothetical protein